MSRAAVSTAGARNTAMEGTVDHCDDRVIPEEGGSLLRNDGGLCDDAVDAFVLSKEADMCGWDFVSCGAGSLPWNLGTIDSGTGRGMVGELFGEYGSGGSVDGIDGGGRGQN